MSEDILKSYKIIGDTGYDWSSILIESTHGASDHPFRGHMVDVFASSTGNTYDECAISIAESLEYQARLIRRAVEESQ